LKQKKFNEQKHTFCILLIKKKNAVFFQVRQNFDFGFKNLKPHPFFGFRRLTKRRHKALKGFFTAMKAPYGAYFDDFDQNHNFWPLIPLEPNIRIIYWNAFWKALYFMFKIKY
jgi:hypothetical protein